MPSGTYIKAKYVGGDEDDSIGQISVWVADKEESVSVKGWVKADGREISIDEYPDLFHVIGHSYTEFKGTPVQVNYFCVPNLSDDLGKCKHSWKKYVGFTDTYEYCTYCDEKSY